MGNPFVHIELNTGDLDAAKRFYKKLFDWRLEDLPMPGGVYTLVEVGKGVGGGMQLKMLQESPSAWLPYVEVADVKKAIAQARKLGAEIVTDFMDLGPTGSAAIFVDPTGAVLGLWAPAKRLPPVKRAKVAAKKVTKKVGKKVSSTAAKTAKVAKKTARAAGNTARKTAKAAKKTVAKARR